MESEPPTFFGSAKTGTALSACQVTTFGSDWAERIELFLIYGRADTRLFENWRDPEKNQARAQKLGRPCVYIDGRGAKRTGRSGDEDKASGSRARTRGEPARGGRGRPGYPGVAEGERVGFLFPRGFLSGEKFTLVFGRPGVGIFDFGLLWPRESVAKKSLNRAFLPTDTRSCRNMQCGATKNEQ